MKKSLFALAAVTAFAGAAQAQSSVTVYGILDVGYVGGNERLATGNTPVSTTAFGNQQVVKQNSSGLTQSAQSTSRLGFRGNEDLGGGTAAFFTLEMEVTPNTAASPVGSSTGNRAAFVGLSQKGMGNAAIGLQNTVITDAMSPTLTGQFNNIVGSLLFPGGIQGRTGAASNETRNGLQTNSANGVTSAFTFRTSNTIKFQSERMAGLQVGAMYVMNNETDSQSTTVTNGGNTTTVLGGKNNQNGWGLSGNYQFKKLVVTAAYMSLKANDPYVSVTTPATGSVAVTPTEAFGNVNTGANVTDNQTYAGAAYDFGILKAYAGWVNRKVTSSVASNMYAKRSAQEIGVRGNWTPKIESWASIGNGRFSAYGNSSPTANLMGWQVGSNYILSKRTNLYAIYGQNSTSNVSTGANTNASSYSSNNYALGIRHTF